jgi:hypothetical protein
MDEELQDKILKGGSTEGYDESEVNAYKMLFNALPKERNFDLPADFADKITEQIIIQKAGPSKDLLWFLGSIAGLFVALISTFFITRYNPDLSFLKSVSPYWGIIALGTVLIFLIQFFDLKFIRLKVR